MPNRGRPRFPDILTPREWEVLDLVRAGLTNAAIAERLGISERTAKFHVSEILGKLGLENREQAAAWRPSQQRRWWTAVPSAIRWGIIAKIAAVAILAVTAVGIAALAYGLLRTEREADSVDANFEPTALKTQARGVAYDGRLEMLLQIDKPLYRIGEPMQLKLTVTNTYDRPLTLYFLDGQRYDFRVGCRRTSLESACFDRPQEVDLGKASWEGVWFWSYGVSFEKKRGKFSLPVGESVTYTENWYQNANSPFIALGDRARVGDRTLPRTGEFHTRYMGGAEFLGCIARTTTIAEAPSLEELACDRPHIGDVVFELVP